MKLVFLFSFCVSLVEESRIHSVRFAGAALQPELETKAGSVLDQAAVTRDVRRLWSTGRFEDLRVERTGDDVVFHVTERPRRFLRDVKIEGDAGPKPQVAAGAMVDAFSAHQAALALRRDLLRDGYQEAVVHASIDPAASQADLLLRVERGRRFRVAEVHFTGDLALAPNELRGALNATRPRTRIPKIWTDRPAFSDEAIESDVMRLRAHYASRGYFDAEVRTSRVTAPDGKVSLEYHVNAGRQYRTRDRNWTDSMCACLFDARNRAREDGHMDFDARIDAQEHAGVVELDAHVESGQIYTIGRIEFEGHRSYSDATLRRAMRVAEGDPFDWNRVYQSMTRLNQLELFQPIAEHNVRIAQDPARGVAHITLSLDQRSHGLWSLSGPVGPVSIGGPFTGSIAARLPKWGRGVLEASTYYAAIGFTGISPLARLLPFAPKSGRLFSASIARSYLPGQEWLSGFSVSPQWGWKSALFNYGLTQGRQRTRPWLAGRPAEQPIAAPIAFGRGSVLLCESPQPRWKWARAAAGMAIDWLLPGVL